MSSGPPAPEVAPLPLSWLAALALGSFLVIFLTSEAIEPRWLGMLRANPSPTPVPTAVARAVRPVPTVSARAANPSPGAAGTPAPLGTVGSASPEPESAPMELVVVFSGGLGARLRVSPGSQADVSEVLEEGATVDWFGKEVGSEGRRWLEVRSPSGAIGWLPSDLLAVRDPTRTPR